MHRFVVAPNEQVRETPFIERNIAATRKAFLLNDVEERELSGDTPLTRADIGANDATLGNVRLWDHQPLLQTFAQIQEIASTTTSSRSTTIGTDRRRVSPDHAVGTRAELGQPPEPQLINERLTFTHGYGLTLGPVNQVTPEGLPVLFIKDIPPQSAVSLQVKSRASTTGSSRTTTCSSRPTRGSFTTRGRGQRLHDLRRHGRRSSVEFLTAAPLQHPVPVIQGAVER